VLDEHLKHIGQGLDFYYGHLLDVLPGLQWPVHMLETEAL
jgi:hypothetical protein